MNVVDLNSSHDIDIGTKYNQVKVMGLVAS